MFSHPKNKNQYNRGGRIQTQPQMVWRAPTVCRAEPSLFQWDSRLSASSAVSALRNVWSEATSFPLTALRVAYATLTDTSVSSRVSILPNISVQCQRGQAQGVCVDCLGNDVHTHTKTVVFSSCWPPLLPVDGSGGKKKLGCGMFWNYIKNVTGGSKGSGAQLFSYIDKSYDGCLDLYT